jgi:MFS family permease
LFSYIGFMILDFGLLQNAEEPQNATGYYAGLLGAIFYVGQLGSSFVWGVLADKFGKRPVMLLGSAGTLITCLAFGFAWTFWFALVVRFLGGLLNGNIGVAKSLLGQISTKATQPQLFGMIGVSWGIGTVVGAFYGGVLARPAVRWAVFKGTIFEKFPYLLPNLVTSAFCLGVLVVAFFMLYDPPLSAKAQRLPKPRIADVFTNRVALMTTGGYAVLGFGFTFLDELMPVWLMSQVSVGGLNFDPQSTGFFNGLLGVFALVVLATLYTPVARRLGMTKTFRIGVFIILPVLACFPLLNWLVPFGNVALWAGIVGVCFLRAVAGQFAFSSVFALISNSVPPQLLGSANGLGQSLVALTRSVGPVVAGVVYAWSVSTPRPFPLNYFSAFVLVGLVMAGLLGMSFVFPISIDTPYAAQEVELRELSSSGSEEIET